MPASQRATFSFNAAMMVACAFTTVSVRQSQVWAQDQNTNIKSLFNGRDLSGWQPEGDANWEVKDGILIGRQGKDNAPGDLLSKREFANFELTVVYRMQWPGNSGVWYRYQSATKAYQADILEYKNPVAYSGSLYCTGKMFLVRNLDPKLEHRNDWNTLVIRVEGDHHVITLNGTKVVDVHDSTVDRGRIGFQVHPGKEFADMRIMVKQVRLQPL